MADQDIPGFHDFEPIRDSWKRLPPAKQDAFLHELVPMLAGSSLSILPVSAGSAVSWPTIKHVIFQTSAKRALLLAPTIMVLTLIVGISFFFTITPWWLAALGFLMINYWSFFKNNFRMVRGAVTKAALEDSTAFVELWELGAFAIGVPSQKDLYSVHPVHNRWQHVVLVAMGWSDLVETTPVGRQQQMNAIFDDIAAAKEKASAGEA